MSDRFFEHIDRLEEQLLAYEAVENPSQQDTRHTDLLKERIEAVRTATLDGYRYQDSSEILHARESITDAQAAAPMSFLEADKSTPVYIEGRRQLILSDLAKQYDSHTKGLRSTYLDHLDAKENRETLARIIEYDARMDEVNSLPQKTTHLEHLQAQLAAILDQGVNRDEQWIELLTRRIRLVESYENDKDKAIERLKEHESKDSIVIDRPLFWLSRVDGSSETKDAAIDQIMHMDLRHQYDPYHQVLRDVLLQSSPNNESLNHIKNSLLHEMQMHNVNSIIEADQRNTLARKEERSRLEEDTSHIRPIVVKELFSTGELNTYLGLRAELEHQVNNGKIISLEEMNGAKQLQNVDKSFGQALSDYRQQHILEESNNVELKQDKNPTSDIQPMIKTNPSLPLLDGNNELAPREINLPRKSTRNSSHNFPTFENIAPAISDSPTITAPELKRASTTNKLPEIASLVTEHPNKRQIFEKPTFIASSPEQPLQEAFTKALKALNASPDSAEAQSKYHQAVANLVKATGVDKDPSHSFSQAERDSWKLEVDEALDASGLSFKEAKQAWHQMRHDTLEDLLAGKIKGKEAVRSAILRLDTNFNGKTDGNEIIKAAQNIKMSEELKEKFKDKEAFFEEVKRIANDAAKMEVSNTPQQLMSIAPSRDPVIKQSDQSVPDL